MQSFVRSGELVNLLDILHNISPERVDSLQKQVAFIWSKYFETPGDIALTTLQIINDRYNSRWDQFGGVMISCTVHQGYVILKCQLCLGYSHTKPKRTQNGTRQIPFRLISPCLELLSVRCSTYLNESCDTLSI